MKLEFCGIYAGYKGKTVVENVSFGVEAGSITALIGRNGAGKSTLIRCLMGQKQDYRGSISLDGQDVRQKAQLSRQIAWLPQELPRPHVTVRELVSFGRTPYMNVSGRLSEDDKAAVEQAIRAAEMEDFSDSFVDALSGGERKKAFFAMVLAQDTPVLVLDEPMAHLDAVSRFEFWELIRRQKGKTVLVVMHDLPEVLRWADRVVALQEKRIAFDGMPEDCLAANIPQRCFGIEIHGDREHGYAVTPVK